MFSVSCRCYEIILGLQHQETVLSDFAHLHQVSTLLHVDDASVAVATVVKRDCGPLAAVFSLQVPETGGDGHAQSGGETQQQTQLRCVLSGHALRSLSSGKIFGTVRWFVMKSVPLSLGH